MRCMAARKGDQGMSNVENPIQQFFDTDGTSLDAGYIYIGITGQNPETNPVQVYWDAALTQPAPQPLRTVKGCITNGSVPARVYISAATFSITVKNNSRIIVFSILDATLLQGQLAASGGGAMVGFAQPGAGAVATTVQDQLRKITILADNFIAPGDADDAVGINRALQYAKTLVAARSAQGEGGAWVHPHGGAEVMLAARNYVTTSATIQIPQNVLLRGNPGKGSTITSSINGQVVRNEDDFGVTYGCVAGGLCDVRIFGDRTKAAQVGVDFLRMLQGCTFHNVEVAWCGSDGVHLRECIELEGSCIDSHDNVGRGWVFDQGVTSWGTMAADGLPTNACHFKACVGSSNDGAGIAFLTANANTFEGMLQFNYKATGTGYQVEFQTGANGNNVQDSWLEGHCLSLALSNAGVGNRNMLTNNFYAVTGNATTGPTRAAIATSGDLEIDGYTGLSVAYPAVAGSVAPFRCTPATTGRIIYRGPLIFGAPSPCIEDPAGNLAGFMNFAYQEMQSGQVRIEYGEVKHYYDHGNIASHYFKTTAPGAFTWETTPWLRINGFLQGIEFDNASAGNYAGVYYRSAGSPEGWVSSYPGSICIVGAGSNQNAFLKAKAYDAANPWNGWLPLASAKKGAFTCSGTAAATVVNDPVVMATSVITLTPTNAAAATLMGSAKCLYVSAKTADTSFTVTTASGVAATGAETFDYTIVN
jgi:hypothetical protein